MRTPAVADRVSETTTTTGTGTVSLAGALTRFRSFVGALGGTRVVEYTIVHRAADEWEVGAGTITAGSPDTLSRTSVKSSSNTGALVSFSAGTKDVFLGIPARRLGTAGDYFKMASL